MYDKLNKIRSRQISFWLLLSHNINNGPPNKYKHKCMHHVFHTLQNMDDVKEIVPRINESNFSNPNWLCHLIHSSGMRYVITTNARRIDL